LVGAPEQWSLCCCYSMDESEERTSYLSPTSLSLKSSITASLFFYHVHNFSKALVYSSKLCVYEVK
jgi:hypothetical protein